MTKNSGDTPTAMLSYMQGGSWLPPCPWDGDMVSRSIDLKKMDFDNPVTGPE